MLLNRVRARLTKGPIEKQFCNVPLKMRSHDRLSFRSREHGISVRSRRAVDHCFGESSFTPCAAWWARPIKVTFVRTSSNELKKLFGAVLGVELFEEAAFVDFLHHA